MNRILSFRRAIVATITIFGLGACASAKKPASLEEAEAIYTRLAQSGADRRVEADMIRSRDAIAQAQNAALGRQNRDFVGGLSNIALRTAQTAEAMDMSVMDKAAADSLRTARLNRLLLLSEAQRNSLAQQQQLSQEEIAALQQRNMMVSSQADSLRQNVGALQQNVDSLQRANAAASAALNAALNQLRTLVVEITNLRETNRGIVISLSDILFDVNQSTLKPGADANVRRIAAILQQYPDKQIVVEGHTDATGSDALNHTLSENRAASVRAALVAGGVGAGSITSRGFGKTQPVATNATAAGRQQNRRVEVVVLGAGTLADAAAAGSGSMMPMQPPMQPPMRDSTMRDSSGRTPR